MNEIKSLADGFELNNETWNNFIERLAYWNQGYGTSSHATANPIFIVREKIKVPANESGNTGIYYNGDCYDHIDDVLEKFEADSAIAISIISSLSELNKYSYTTDFDRAEAIVEHLDDAYIYYWKWDYRTVNFHLTKEAAERFIKRKQHDHGELSIYVESAYWCWELRTIIDAMLDGKIKYIGGDDEI